MGPTPAQLQASKAQQLIGSRSKSRSKAKGSGGGGGKGVKKKGKSKVQKARVQRYLKNHVESQVHERSKHTLLLRGMGCSQSMANVLKEIKALSCAGAKMLTKKNQLVPFTSEGQQSIEFLTAKNDCALFATAAHNKKRPNNLIIGRTFDRQQILDMAELGVVRFKSMADYAKDTFKKRVGSKPMLMFAGSLWEQEHSTGGFGTSAYNYRNLQNLLIDLYRGDVVDELMLTGLDHVIVFTLAEHTRDGCDVQQVLLHQRTYFCQIKKQESSSEATPSLTPSGPDIDFVLRRTQWAEPDMYKAARQLPHQLVPGKKKKKRTKNQSTNIFGETVGRLHIQKQDVTKGQGRKSKALKRAEKNEKDQERAAVDQELQQEKERIDQEYKYDALQQD